MKDETVLRLVQDASQKLEHVRFPVTTPNLIPVYNALLAAAKANHPGDSFLALLPALTEGETGPEEMRVLLGQLRIVLEALHDERTASPSSGAGFPTPPPNSSGIAGALYPPPQER